MTHATQLYEDRWGEVIDRPHAGYVEIRWYDSTQSMTRSDFEVWLTMFAGQVELVRRPGVLVDSTRFLMDPGLMNAEWRDTNIVPRYNAAGVRKFAFHMPEGMPMNGTPPAVEGPANYPTGYFARRHDAVAWITT
jgi:hypothetical protein